MLFPPDVLRQCWLLAGPTAAGKTGVALELARLLNAEIVSMDSMAIFRNMDIGTAKPDPDERKTVRHHLIDVVDAHENYSVADYLEDARTAVVGILARNRVPLFVGGTGLYLRSILRGVFDGPPANHAIRQELTSEAPQHPAHWLHSELARIDPVSAGRLHPNDERRIIRALEVYRLTGRTLSAQQQQPARPAEEQPVQAVWLEPPRDWLHDRINLRVSQMMESGLLEETRSLLNQNPPPGRTARQALGYRELIAHLEHNMPLDVCIEQIRRGTRQFAKRQHTWFRNLDECRSVTLSGAESPAEIASRLISLRNG